MGNDRSSVDPMLSSNRSNIVASSCMDNGYKKSIIFGSTILAKSVLLMVDEWVSYSPDCFFVHKLAYGWTNAAYSKGENQVPLTTDNKATIEYDGVGLGWPVGGRSRRRMRGSMKESRIT